MSIIETNKVDTIGSDKISGQVILTISDHLDWEDELSHLNLLQEKLNAYIEFIEGGQIFEDYPSSSGKEILIQIISKFDYPKIGFDFLGVVRPVLKSIGANISQKVIDK